jgi:hypothetical protein
MKNIRRIGFWSALLAFLFTVAYCVIQLLQVKRVLHYPLDEILIYGSSLGIVIPFLLAMVALHFVTPPVKKFWTQAAWSFTILYAVFVSANYVVQLATVIPMKLKGAGAEVRLLEQTPHSLFWDFDAMGYIFMGLAMLLAVPALEKTGFQKWTRRAFLANGLVTPLITVVYFYPNYSEKLLMLGYPWAITAPLAMLMLALLFYKKENNIILHSSARVHETAEA